MDAELYDSHTKCAALQHEVARAILLTEKVSNVSGVVGLKIKCKKIMSKMNSKTPATVKKFWP